MGGVDLAGATLVNVNLSGTLLATTVLRGVISSGVTGTPASLPSGWVVTAGRLFEVPTSVWAGHYQTCSVLGAGDVACWGSGWGPTPMLVPGLPAIQAVSGDCELTVNGSVFCGSPGTGTPTQVAGLAGVTSIAGADDHSCALESAGTVWCWGSNVAGGLGNGTTVDSSTPVEVSGISTARSITVGDAFSCALLAFGTVTCWGANSSGQLGNGGTSNSSTPATIWISGIASIASGFASVCAITTSGTVTCWGSNSNGQFGPNVVYKANQSVPVATHTVTGATQIAEGRNWTCVLTATGGVQCWGANQNGQLGNGYNLALGPGPDSPTPSSVSGLPAASAISAGEDQTCAVTTTQALYCWGGTGFGQLGNGGGANQSTPVSVVGLP